MYNTHFFLILENLWHFKRKLVSPALYYIALEKFVKIFSDKGNILIKELKRKENNGIFDITPYVEKYAFDTILGKLKHNHEVVIPFNKFQLISTLTF